MKICILTQPLHFNYGGLLQAYALQQALKRLGHQVWTEDREYNYTLKSRLKVLIFRMLSLIPFQKKIAPPVTNEQKMYIRKKTNLFKEKYISTTETIHTTSKEQLEKYHFNAYVVGSDQVWRPMYSPRIENYFLDFTIGKQVKRVAYAASFGTSNWEFSPRQTKRCAALAKHFDAISVREQSGIELCRNYFGVEAEQVLDPTMLLEKEDYEEIVKVEEEIKSPGSFFCYILDDTPQKQNVIMQAAKVCGLKPFRVMPELPFTPQNAHSHLEGCVYPRVTQWLRAFMDAEMVVTDSFHGCVFSIIFNKPFWVIGNKERGLARFDSLLSTFGLEHRLLSVDELQHVDWKAGINWNRVNTKREALKEKSLLFLKNNLS